MALPVNYNFKRAEEAPGAHPPAPMPNWVQPDFGTFPFPHDYDKPFIKSARWGENGNVITATMRIRSIYLHDAIFWILGYARRTANPPQIRALDRWLPIRIPMDVTAQQPQYWGMVATNITGIRVLGDTGKAGPVVAGLGFETFSVQTSNLHQTIPATAPDTSLIPPDDPLWRYYYAEIDIEFSHPKYQLLNDYNTSQDGLNLGELNRYMICNLITGGEYNALPKGVVKWDANDPNVPPLDRGKDVTAGAGVLIPTGTFQVQWLKVPRQAVADLMTLIFAGNYNYSMNATAMTFYIYEKAITAAQDTLLFMPIDTPPEPLNYPNGEIYYNLFLKFLYRKNTWKKMMHPNGQFCGIVTAAGNLYPETEHRDLFLINK